MASFFCMYSKDQIIRHWFEMIALALVALVALLCYAPGLHGGFMFDDVPNLQNNPAIRIPSLGFEPLWQAAMSGSAGMLQRPISMMSFALNTYWGGLDPYHFKSVNLAIHLLNGIGLYCLTRLVLGLLHRPQPSARSVHWVGVGMAALWLLHPLNLTGVLYVVQRMTSLSALFTIVGLCLYLWGRERQISGQGGWHAILSAFFICTPLAALSKESGLLLPAFMLLAEWTLLRGQTPGRGARIKLAGLFVFTLILPVLALLTYVVLHPEAVTGGYLIRDFTLTERLMTEARVLWFYLHMTLLPDISAMGFFHDDIIVSRGLFVPPTTLPAVAGVLLLLAAGLALRNRYPLASFGILFFLTGHSMESTVIALELVHEHRNYLPMFGILLPVVFYALSPRHHPPSLRLRTGVVVGLAVLFAGLTWIRAGHWSDPLTMLQTEVRHHPDSARANSDLAFHYAYLRADTQAEAEQNYRNAIQHFSRAAYASPTDTSGFFGVFAVNAERGLPTDPSWTDELARRLRHVPSSPASVNSLMALEKCLARGRCKHSPESMERLLHAALRNPTLYGPRRSTVLFALSDFQFRVRHQTEQAARTAARAVAAAPGDLAQRLTLIVFLINMGKHDAAAEEIARGYRLDRRGTHARALAQLEFQLTMKRSQSPGVAQ